MRLLVTGASGFLGDRVVARALERGHEVCALDMPTARVEHRSWSEHERLTLHETDLRRPEGLDEVLSRTDVVLHLAAAKSGSLSDQLEGTVATTERLLRAMDEACTLQLVAISSMSVYGYSSLWSWSRLTEQTPLESTPRLRDAYCQAKLLQEQLVREWASVDEARGCTILRPGVIWGPGSAWTARLGFRVGNLVFRTGGLAPVPLTYVDNCAEAIVLCAEKSEKGIRTLNVVDDRTPSQRTYCRMWARIQKPRPTIIPIPFPLMRLIAGAGSLVNRLFFGGSARIPSIFESGSLLARCRPLRYTNRALREYVDWQPGVGLDEGMRRCAESDT